MNVGEKRGGKRKKREEKKPVQKGAERQNKLGGKEEDETQRYAHTEAR